VPRQRPVGFGAVDRWSPLSCSAPDSPMAHRTCPVRSDFAALTTDRALYTFCSRPLTQVTVAPLAHRTCPVHTGQSGEL
jgi:hypothetical protein